MRRHFLFFVFLKPCPLLVRLPFCLPLSFDRFGTKKQPLSATAGASPLGDDTETDEDPGHGAQPSAGDGVPCGSASSETRATPAGTCQAGGSSASSSNSSGAEGLSTAPVFPTFTGATGFVGVEGVDNLRRGSSTTDRGGGGCGRGRGKAVRGRGRGGQEANDLRRLRRRRDEDGASTPGENSPKGADAENDPSEGGLLPGGRGGQGGRGLRHGRMRGAARRADSSLSLSSSSSSDFGPGVPARPLAPSAAINTKVPAAQVSAPGVSGGGGGGIFPAANGAPRGDGSQSPTKHTNLPAAENGGDTDMTRSIISSIVGVSSSAPDGSVGAETAALVSSFVGPSAEAAVEGVGGLDAMVTDEQQQQQQQMMEPLQQQALPVGVGGGADGEFDSQSLDADALLRSLNVGTGVGNVGAGGGGGLDDLLVAAAWGQDVRTHYLFFSPLLLTVDAIICVHGVPD